MSYLTESERKAFTLKCPTCGGDGVMPDRSGSYGQPGTLLCGCEGYVVLDDVEGQSRWHIVPPAQITQDVREAFNIWLGRLLTSHPQGQN